MATTNLPDLSVQKVSDFFSSATRNITITIWLVRLIAAFMLYLLVTSIWTILIPEVKEFSNLVTLLQVIVLIAFVLILALLTLVTFISTIFNFQTGNVALHYFYASRAFVVNQIFGNVPVPDGMDANAFFGAGTDPFGPMAYLLNKPQRVLYNTEALYGMILLGLVIVLISGVGFIRRSSVYLSGITLVVSQLIIALAYLKGLTLPLTLNSYSIVEMFDSSLFRLAFISYLYLEFSLQTGYLYSLTSPTLTRQERVGKQLSRLSKFRLGITKLGTEEEQEAQRAKEELQEEEEGERTSSALAAGSGSTSAKKYSADALLFLLDSAQDSLFAKPGGEQERLTNRLQRYHDGLLQHDPKLDDKLGGSAAKAFNPFLIFFVVITSLAVRLVVLIFFAWLVLNPAVMLTFIALPESITNSLEIGEPEGLLLVLIPIIFLIIGGSYLVARVQQWLIKAEELIIEEGEIGKLLKEGKSISSREEAELARAQMNAPQTGETANSNESTSDEGQAKRRRQRRRQ